MLKNVTDVTSEGKQIGLNTQDNILGLDKKQSPNMMNVVVNFDGSIEKRMGSNTQNSVIIANSAGAGFSPAGTLTSNLKAFWRMDEPSGNRSDSYGGHTLIDNNGVPSDGGIKNKAAQFVAANTQYLLHANTSTLSPGNSNFSISTWFYLNSTNPTVARTLVAKKDVAADGDAVLLLHCDGADGSTTFTDSSLSPKSVTAMANAQVDTAQFKFGTGSALFDTLGDGLSIPDSPDWDFGTGAFTVELWFRNNTNVGDYSWVRRDDGVTASFVFGGNNSVGNLNIYMNGVSHSLAGVFTPNTAQWYHAAVTRDTVGDVRVFIDGVQKGATFNDLADLTTNVGIKIGINTNDASSYDGWLDDIRIVKGRAVYTSNFTPPAAALTNPANPSQYEYWLFVNTDNVLTFKVSNNGSSENITLSATSFGALTTSTWYNAVAYHDSSNGFLGIGINRAVNSAAYTSGVRSGSAPFVIGAVSNGLATSFFDGRIDETGFWGKVLTASDMSNLYNAGSANTFQTAFDNKPWASFDFGASSIRWLTVAAGTGIYASSNLGATWVTVATDRSATYQYFERSKNVLIATSDLYNTPLYWTGSAGTFMVMVNNSAPLCKYSVNFQGFLILLNSNTRKRGFFYQDENTQLTGAWSSSFDIPSSQDDEITSAFVLAKNLYVSTRYFLYRVSYVGGNPDFSFEKVKDWGYVSRTVKQVYVEGAGQVVKGLCWDGKTRLFDGSEDQISSDNIEDDNSICEFSLDNLSFAGSGPVVSFAETDPTNNVYKLCVAIGADSTQTTHIINYDGRGKSFYPFDRQHFNTMVMAESGNRRYLMAFDRSGYCHMLNSGNLDGNTTPINDYIDSNIIFEKSPAQVHKGHQTHMFFANRSCGRLLYLDRSNFANDFTTRRSFVISGSDRKFHVHEVVDVPESYNTYQWRLTSSSGTSDPWKLQRYDHMTRGLGIGPSED